MADICRLLYKEPSENTGDGVLVHFTGTGAEGRFRSTWATVGFPHSNTLRAGKDGASNEPSTSANE